MTRGKTVIKEQFNEIKERLAKWREERKLTYENQSGGFPGKWYKADYSKYYMGD